MRLVSLYILLVLLFTSSVQAREEFWYVGAGGGGTSLDDKDAVFSEVEKKDTVVKAYVGYRVSTYIALEAEYVDFGTYDVKLADTTETQSLDVSAFDLSIVVMYPLIFDDFELFTPVGLSTVLTDFAGKKDDVFGYKLGFGVGYTPVKHFSLRLGGNINVFDLETQGVEFKQNLYSYYLTAQYNF